MNEVRKHFIVILALVGFMCLVNLTNVFGYENDAFKPIPGNIGILLDSDETGTLPSLSTFKLSSLVLSERAFATFQLSGNVTDPVGVPVQGALVEIINPSSGMVVASLPTDINGRYAFSLLPDTYNIKITSPLGSGFQNTIILNRRIDTNIILNIVLTPLSPLVTVSGRVLDGLGNGIPDELIGIRRLGGGVSLDARTDSSGFYSFNVPPGEYFSFIENNNLNNLSSPYPPRHFFKTQVFSIAQNTVIDFPLQFRKVSIHVQDTAGNAVSNVQISTNYLVDSATGLGIFVSERNAYQGTGLTATTDSNGDAVMWLIPPKLGNTYGIFATPPAGTNYSPASLLNFSFENDTSATITLPSPITISGRVLDGLGNGIPSETVSISGSNAGLTTTTDSSGFYSFNVLPGQYLLAVERFSFSNQNFPYAPTHRFRTRMFSFNQNTVMDIPLPLKKVSIHVQDMAGNPISNVQISTGFVLEPATNLGIFFAGMNAYQGAGLTANTDINGDTVMWLMPTEGGNNYGFFAAPPPGTNYSQASVLNFAFETDASLVIIMRPKIPPTISGQNTLLQRGDEGIISPIALVNDDLTPAGNLIVTLGTIPSGISISNVINSNGTITAIVGANCSANLGNNIIPIQVTDSDGLTTNGTLTVNVTQNPSPTVTISNPPSGATFPIGTPVNFAGNFVDNAGDIHTAQWSYSSIGNSFSQPSTVDENTRTVNATTVFNTPGVYLVNLTVTDKCGNAATATTVNNDLQAMVVIYDPDGGFVTGGGWINSPVGAFRSDPALTGKASFGFVSKYQRGANVPTGNTEFQFKTAIFSFSSTNYDWLVISGAKAQYKGSGTINGSGDYRFMLTAIDGQENGGGGTDRFRIKIWDRISGGIIYDNQVVGDISDDGLPATTIGGGNIVIHR